MNEQLKWVCNDRVLLLSGKLDRYLLKPLWDVRYEIMQGIQQIDLYNITNVDTAGIALLIHLVAISKKQGMDVFITGINKNVCALAQLYNLPADVFPY